MTDHSPSSPERTVEQHTAKLGDDHQRIVHAEVTVPLDSGPDEFFAVYATHDRFRLELDDTGAGLAATETCYFEVQSAHVPVLSGFLDAPGLDTETFETFLEARLTRLDSLLQREGIDEADLNAFFVEDRDVADDWAGRISEGDLGTLR